MRRPRLVLLLAFFLFLVSSISFWPRFSLYDRSTVASDDKPLDFPFARSCDESQEEQGPRANATFMMLCRESELLQVLETVRSVEKHFNSRFHYPYVLFSDEPFSNQFQSTIRKEVSSVTFHTVAQEAWGFPDWIDLVRARAAFAKMKAQGVRYGDKEGYHHMCRFFSGFFYKQEALKPFRWYWRLEPGVEFFCQLTYDPFLDMQRHGKVYGFTIAIWEFGNTVQSLAWKISNHYNIDPALRPMMHAFLDRRVPASIAWVLFYLGGSRSRGFTRSGFKWSMCHFWSNFEIADLDWFRGNEYEEFFNIIDKDGGIYYERWGDASIHSLAVGLFLKPEQVHYFGDNIGYRHDVFMCCPAEGATGCKCDCRSTIDATVPSDDCLNAYKRAVRWSLEPPSAMFEPESSAIGTANLSRDEPRPNW